MTDALDREELIRLLERLGEPDDSAVLTAARDLHAKVAAAGASWNDLLVPDKAAATPEADVALPPEEEPAAEAGPLPDDAEALRLVEGMLRTKDLSEQLRDELDGYKEDIAAGEFDEMDRRYVRALQERLSRG